MSNLMIECFPDTSAPAPLGRLAVAAANTAVLLDALRPDVHLAIWHRSLPEALGPGLAALTATPFSAEGAGEPEAAVDALAAALPGPAPLGLLNDVLTLASLFAVIARAPDVHLRLDTVTHRACPRWHADAVGLRLLCTYRGPGTEWLCTPGGAAAARALPRRGATPAPPGRLATGAVALLKGEDYPGNAGAGLIHRSPPATAGAPRLVLCVDALKDPRA